MRTIEKIRFILSRYPFLTPSCFAAFFILSGFHEMQDYVRAGSLFWPLLITTAFALLLFLLLKKISHNSIKAAVLTTVILITILFFGPLRHLFESISITAPLARYRYLLVLILSAITFIGIKIVRSGKTFCRFNEFLCTFGFIIVMTELIKILCFPLKNSQWKEYAGARENIPVLSSADQKPNVFFLLFDMHTGPESLERYWNYEDTALTGYLASKDFCLVKNARSNYNYTLYSLASTLNMRHLDQLPEYKSGLTARINALGDAIRNSSVIKTFNSSGYDIVNLSPFDLDNQRRLYTRYYTFSLAKYLWDKTLPGRIIEDILWNAGNINKKSAQLFSFQDADNVECNIKVIAGLNDEIKKLRTDKKPAFVYAHFLLPHYPYHYDREGQLRSIENDRISDKGKYLDQLIYTDKLIQSITDSILRNSNSPPVIIIQGDHGFNMLNSQDKTKESHSILNAVYFPGCKSAVYDSITPVNTFRVLFNLVFHTDLKLSKDKLFYVDEDKFGIN